MFFTEKLGLHRYAGRSSLICVAILKQNHVFCQSAITHIFMVRFTGVAVCFVMYNQEALSVVKILQAVFFIPRLLYVGELLEIKIL